jgi:hypothetical protein
LKTIPLTGAAGDVAGFLKRKFVQKYTLRLSDLRSVDDLRDEERFVQADLYRFDDVK